MRSAKSRHTERAPNGTPFGIGRRAARAAALGQLLLILGLAAYGLYAALHDTLGGANLLFDRALYSALIIGPGLLCIARAALVPTERAAWLLFGLNLTIWGLGETYWSIFTADDPNAPNPAPDDAIILFSYLPAFAAVAMLVHSRARRFRRITWLDGALAALTVAASGTALLLPRVIDALEGPALADAVTLAYPIIDTMLLALLLSVLVLLGWRLDRSWMLIAASLAILPLADGVYSYQDATGTYTEGGVVDFMFPLSAVLLGLAAWRPGRRELTVAVRGWRSLATPGVFAVAAGALLLWGYGGGLNQIAVAFAGAALLGGSARLAITYRENQRLFHRAHTDGLTGLGNRSALMLDLDDALAEDADPKERIFVMFDLNGFKLYNDTFGHPAGDRLLSRLAGRFADAARPDGKAYRIGGDEFCALLECPQRDGNGLLSRVNEALRESGEGFDVSAAHGTSLLPQEADSPHAALRLADRRMYQDKAGSRSSARSQAQEVLMRALREREPELGVHVDRVAQLSAAVARRLGIEGEKLDVVTRAGELHDIGKMAIPDAVLNKPAALDAEEWQFIQDHTLVGERILREAPALAPVAQLVRSSHERWDGEGYPDGLAGAEIPIGARIIFACDAFHAMTSERPYAPSLQLDQAVAELRRCAGSQFDPAVVDELCAELEATTPIRAPHAEGAPGRSAG